MNITKQTTEGLNGLITIHLEPKDYKPAIQEGLKRYAKKANIPGFRPGMAPAGMIKRMAGKSIAIDAITQMVNREMDAYLDEQQLDLLGQPLPTEQKEADYFDENATRTLEFSFEVGFAPKVELNLNFTAPVTKYDIEVDEAFIEEQLTKLRTRFGTPEQAETVEQGDYLFVRFDEVNAEGEVVEGGFNTHTSITPDKISNPKAFEPLLGLKVEDQVIYDIRLLGGSHEEIAKALFTDHDTVHDLFHKTLRLTIRRINRNMPAEINAEFIANVLGTRAESVENEEQLRAFLAEDIAKQLSKESVWVYNFYLRKALTELNKVELPAAFLRKWLLASQEKVNETNVDHELEHTLEGLQWQTITEEIIKQNPDLKVMREDIEASLRDEINDMMGGMLDESKMQEYVDYMFKQEEIVRKHIGKALDERVYGFLATHVKTNEEKISATEFAKLEIN